MNDLQVMLDADRYGRISVATAFVKKCGCERGQSLLPQI